MVKNFKHKGLQKFFSSGSTAGIQTNHATRLEDRLQALHSALTVEDMNLLGWITSIKKGMGRTVGDKRQWKLANSF